MTKENLSKLLSQGKSSRDIGKIYSVRYWDILKLIDLYDIADENKYGKPKYKDVKFFDKIDTMEKAYILGFVLGDGHISKENKFEMNISMQDRVVIDYISDALGCNVIENNKTDIKKKKYPNVGIKIGNQQLMRGLNKQFGGRLKPERHIPIIPKHLEIYLLLGFFDAEGCITWGIRKDRDRVWQKVSFTSHFKMLEGIQNILIKNDISTKIKKKSDSNCYVLEFSSKKIVLRFLDLIYPNDNFIILKRKFEKAQALRLELGEFGES